MRSGWHTCGRVTLSQATRPGHSVHTNGVSKHRTKRIVFFAVAMVVLAATWVIVLTLQARSAPYKFMSGATATSVIFNKPPVAPTSMRNFELNALFDDVATSAQAELSASGGWSTSPVITTRLGAQALRFEAGSEAVLILSLPSKPGVVSIVLSRPPTIGDRCAWLLDGAKTYPP